VARVHAPDNFVDQLLGCDSRDAIVNDATLTSLSSLFLAWVCFSVAFSTVFQAFLTTFLIDSGYKTPIQIMEELFASGIKLAYRPDFSSIFEIGEETEVSKVHRRLANCPSNLVCTDWAKYKKMCLFFS